jgi:hypothetical protein
MTSQEEMGHPNDNDHQLSVFVTIGLNELHTRLLVENDAKAALGTSRIFSTQDKQDYLKIMQIRKENIREWSRQRIEKLMLAEAVKQELRSIDGSGALVCTLKEVQQVFATDGSLETGRKVWHVCFMDLLLEMIGIHALKQSTCISLSYNTSNGRIKRRRK